MSESRFIPLPSHVCRIVTLEIFPYPSDDDAPPPTRSTGKLMQSLLLGLGWKEKHGQ